MDLGTPFCRDGDITTYWRDEPEGGFTLTMSSDITAALEANKDARNHNDGYSKSRELRRAAHIPDLIIYKWLVEEGLNIYDKNAKSALIRKLNDPDYAYLRTADGRLGHKRMI